MFLAFLLPLAGMTLVLSWHQESQTDDHFFSAPHKRPDAKLNGIGGNIRGFGSGPERPARNNAENVSGAETVQRD